jgi:hypothetical protein
MVARGGSQPHRQPLRQPGGERRGGAGGPRRARVVAVVRGVALALRGPGGERRGSKLDASAPPLGGKMVRGGGHGATKLVTY